MECVGLEWGVEAQGEEALASVTVSLCGLRRRGHTAPGLVPPRISNPGRTSSLPTCVGHEAHGKEEVVSEG